MSKYPEVLLKLETSPCVTTNTVSAFTINSPPTLTLKVPQTTIIPLPTPPHSRNSSAVEKMPLLPTPSSLVPPGPQVRDPVDVAVESLVAMGFEESRVKKALAETDSGNSVDVGRAMEKLVRERKRVVTSVGPASWVVEKGMVGRYA